MADVIEKLKEYAQYAETKSEKDTFEVAFQEIARLRRSLDRIQDDILDHIEDCRKPNNDTLMMWRRDACDALGKTGLRAAIREGGKDG